MLYKVNKIGFLILYMGCGFFLNELAAQVFLHLIMFNLVFTQLYGPFVFV